MTSVPSQDERTELVEDFDPRPAMPWRTVVWNDPVNLMSYVSYVFRSYFGFSSERAQQLMMQVHHEGRAVVSHGSKEKMEVDVYAMQSYGLWATLEVDE